MSRRLKPKPEALAARIASGHVPAETNGHANPKVEQVIELRDLETMEVLAGLEAIVTRTNGWMKHEDQVMLRRARALLAKRR